MKLSLFILCSLLTISSLSAFNTTIYDLDNLIFFTSTLGINITAKTESSVDFADIQDASVQLLTTRRQERSLFYLFAIHPSNPSSLVKSLNLTIETQNSTDDVRRYVNEFELSVTFDPSKSALLANVTGEFVFIVRPPRFPHFQVKTDWQYRCPKQLSLTLCHVENRTTNSHCSNQWPYNVINVNFMLKDVVFSGGKNISSHTYTDKVEECPLAYETRKDIGIACIAVFWGIAAAFLLWGVIKYLMKRHRKRMD